MQQLSKNVIVDLLPAYLSDEVSDETRALVDDAAARDPAIATLIATARAQQFEPPPSQPPRNLEMQTIRRTRSRLRRQMWMFTLAVVCSLLPLMFAVNDGRFSLFNVPKQAALLWVLAAALWLEYSLLGREEARRPLTDTWRWFLRKCRRR